MSTFSSTIALGTKIHMSDSSVAKEVVAQIAWAQPFIEHSFNVILITFIYAAYLNSAKIMYPLYYFIIHLEG